ncbi:peptidase S41 [Marinifilum breve]|uniref:Peptidase S41 n=1 Tax=Marinifilum breve TaxID=2184082 RepID=A0A2V4AFE2_9BACT|nr:S41 family peptidase [Marinifilum breve]PXY02814.1 peptidase S41 [Marinifilum breve]
MKKSRLLMTIIIIGLISYLTISFFQTQNRLWETKKLATTAKVWGFLKYYHPNIGKDPFYWDKQLFTVLSQVKEAGNREELSKVYLELLDSLGEVPNISIVDTIPADRYFNKNFNLDWISNEEVFSKELCSKLKFIEENRAQGDHYYVSSVPYVGNIQLKNEPLHNSFDWTKKEYRLLSLFKYWNIIEYFFPYKYQMDQNWDEALIEMIPKFANCQSEKEFHLAMLELVVKINDSHAGLRTSLTNQYLGSRWIPAKFKIIDEQAIITGFYDQKLAKEDDLQIGDILTSVNGKSISKILKEKDKYIHASNASVKLRNAYKCIFNGSSDSLHIEYIRNGKGLHKTIRRYPFSKFKLEKSKDPKWKILENNIGYVNMGILERMDVPAMMDSLMNTKAIVFDVRNYPRGSMYDISNYLNEEPKEFVKFTVPNLNYPGKFTWTQSIKCGGKEGPKYKGQVVILVNEETQSHAEFTTMCLQTAPNAIVIGSQTSGADGNVSQLNIPGDFKSYMTGIGVFYPDGRETQRIGIVPDIEVKPTAEGLKAQKDEVLEKAIETIGNTLGKTIAQK